MATQLQIRRGTSTQVAAFTGAEGEIVVNTTNDSIVVSDGSTAGGFEMARADLNNVSDTDLNAALTGNTVSALTITTLTLGSTAITATGTELNLLDGVTATTAELNYVDGVTSAIQTQIDTKAPLASPTFTGTATMGGLEIATSASDIGVDLKLNGNKTSNGAIGSIIFENNGDSVSMIRSNRASANDAADMLFYTQATGGANTQRMAITSAGIDVTGTVTADGLTVDGTTTTSIDGSNYTFSGTNYDVHLLVGSTAGGVRLGQDSSTHNSVIGTTGTNDLEFVTYNGSAWGNRMTLTNTGNLLQGITTIPTGVQSSRQLISSSATGAEIIAYREDNGVAVNDFCGAFLIGNDDNSGTEDHFAGMWGQVSTVSGNMDLKFAAGRDNYESGSPHMTLDYSGNLLVGTTTAHLTSSTFAGYTQFAGGHSIQKRSGGIVAYYDRLTDDGTIMQFRHQGAAVGSIACRSSGGNLQIHTNQSGIDFGGDGYLPMRGSTITDNSLDIGSSSFRYDDIYATNGTIQTSDRNEKQDIEALSEAEQRVAVAAKGLLRKFRWISSVEENGDDARIHFGIIAQDLQDAFTAEGLDAGRYAMFISSAWTDEDTGEERTRLGVRYSELLAFIISAI